MPTMASWPADSVEKRPVAALVPYARNARTHSDAQIAQIAGSIKEWGWTVPVLVDEAGVIIAGHGRVLAALRLGLVEVPVMVARGWSEEQKRAYLIADNKLTENGGWDKQLLMAELQGLGDLQGMVGFSADELLGLLGGNQGLTDPDEAPPIPAEPVTQPGDLWLLGPHRLVCGDATSAGDVATALAGTAPHLMVTDPPYGVDYDADWRNRAIMVKGERVGAHGSRAIGRVENDDRADWRQAWALFPGQVAYVWHGGLHAALAAASLADRGLKIRAQIVWVKTRPVIGRGNYHWQHEPLLYAVEPNADDGWRFVAEHEVASYVVKDGERAEYVGDRKQSTVWFIEHLKSDTGHSTQKPVECMKRPLINNSRVGDAVYDPFIGSGTTIIAAEITGRVCHALEISPAYCDVAVARWENFTGRKAERQAARANAA